MRTSRFLLLLVLIQIRYSTFAQDFAPIGSEWYYSSSAEGTAPTGSEYYHLVVTKDTLINDFGLRKIDRTYYRYRGDSIKVKPYFIYQNGDTVSLYNPDLYKFYRLFVFNASQGDTLTFDIPYKNYPLEDTTYRVIIDTVVNETYDGTVIKKYELEQLDDFGWMFSFYLDKVGGYEWFLPIGIYTIPEHDGPIRCYHDNDINVNFTTQDCEYRIVNSIDDSYAVNLKLFPNPTSGLLEVDSDIIIDRIIVLDYSGKKLLETETTKLKMNNLQAGIYFLEIYYNEIKIVKRVIKK